MAGPTTKQTLQQLLRRNHNDYHIIYGGYRHNHMVHHLYAIYRLGADSARLERCLDEGSRRLEPRADNDTVITQENWRQHLGRHEDYASYLKFFEEEIRQGKQRALDKYVPPLLTGSVARAGHPLIHLGYGVEFDDDLVLSEGLALMAIDHVSLDAFVDDTMQQMQTLNGQDVGFFEVMTRVTADERLAGPEYGDGPLSKKLRHLTTVGKDIFSEYLNSVLITPENLEQRMHELFETTATVYSGTSYEARPDFFLLHAVTVAHAMRMVYPHLPVTERVRLLRTVWAFQLITYIVQRRPPIKPDTILQPYYEANTEWPAIIRKAIATADDHVPKMVYAMQQAEQAFGDRQGKWRAIAAMTVECIKDTEQYEFDGHTKESAVRVPASL